MTSVENPQPTADEAWHIALPTAGQASGGVAGRISPHTKHTIGAEGEEPTPPQS